MKTYPILVRTLPIALKVIEALAHNSVWFSFEPEPDDCYTITVKKENERMLFKLWLSGGDSSY
jgi:hypothetical protein